MGRGRPRNLKPGPVDKSYIGVAEKIFSVLEYFMNRGAKHQSVAFQEIFTALPFARTTVYRILYSLEKLGYVEKGETDGCYHLGSKFFELSQPVVQWRRMKSVANAAMVNLLVRYAETVNLGVLEDGQTVYIEVLQCPSVLRIAASPGDLNLVHSTALGKVLIAYLPQEEIESILEKRPLIRVTPRTITEKAHFLEHLASVREQGVAFDMEENVEGVVCVAAPIWGSDGRVIAGLSVSGPMGRMQPKLMALRDDVHEAGLRISRILAPHSSRQLNSRAPKAVSPISQH